MEVVEYGDCLAVVFKLALPVLAVAVTGLLWDRNVCTCMYDGVLGGDPVLFQHLSPPMSI